MYNKKNQLIKIVNKILERKPDQCGFYKDIDLQDLLLAYFKKTGFSKDSYRSGLGINYIVNKIDLSQPLSSQKEEVYNKLIKILK